MKLFDKYRLNKANEDELNAMTELLIKDKLDREKRREYSERLLKEYGITRSASTANIRLLNIRRIVAVAAILLLGIIAWQMFAIDANYNQLTDEYLAVQYANNELRKGEVVDLGELRVKAITAYNNKAYQEAAQLRQQVAQTAEATEYDFFFLGLSYLYQQPAVSDKAIEAFRQAIAHPQKELLEESEWHLALSYLKAGQLNDAKQLLQQIVDNQSWQDDKAEQLLKALSQN